MIQINKRSIGMCILLSIITCGIYGIYWMYLLVENTRYIQKNTDSCIGEMLCLIFVPYYSLYWWYTRGEKVRQGFAEHDYNATGGGVVYLVLEFFGLSIVSMAIMQSDFNSLKSETHSEQRSTKKRSFFERIAGAPYVAWSALFIIAPLLFVIYFAFTDRNGSFTFENILSLSSYSQTFIMSLAFSLIATTVCLLIGYPLAYCMSKTSERTRGVLMVLLMLPMWISLLIRTYSLMALLDNGGLVSTFLVKIGFEKLTFIGTDGAVILGMIYDFLPYMVLPIYTSITKLDKRYIEASADLGCNPFQTLIKVMLPLTMPGIVSGVTMVFVPSISTFYISQKLGGGSFDLIGDTIERQFQNAVTYHTGAAISLVMMILILISLAVMNKFSDNDGEIIV